jgi:hypothetical protein
MGLQHYNQDMSKIPIKYNINVLFTQSIHTLRLSVGGRTHARMHGRMDGRKIFTQYSGISSCSVGSTYNWLRVWVDAKHPSFEGCSLNTSDDVRLQMNNVTNKIVQDTITTNDSTIIGVSTMLDAKNEEIQKSWMVPMTPLHRIRFTLQCYQNHH